MDTSRGEETGFIVLQHFYRVELKTGSFMNNPNISSLSSVSGRHFFVYTAGNRTRVQNQIISKFIDCGQMEVQSAQDSDYYVVFCPVASRVGTDIDEALENVPSKYFLFMSLNWKHKRILF